MSDIAPEGIVRKLRERGARYVVDTQNQPVAVLLTIEEYEHYLDLLDDEDDSQDEEMKARLAQAAVPSTSRSSLRAYLSRRPPADAEVQG